MTVNPTNYNLDSLNQLYIQVKESKKEAKSKLGLLNKPILWLAQQKGEMPEWAIKHVKITQELDIAVKEIQAQGVKVPENVLKELINSKSLVNKITKKIDIDVFLKAVKGDTRVEPHALLQPPAGAPAKNIPPLSWNGISI